MGVMIGGRGFGKTTFSQVIIDAVSDGDLTTKNSVIEYSTDVREVVTVDYMIKHHNLTSQKGMIVDVRV